MHEKLTLTLVTRVCNRVSCGICCLAPIRVWLLSPNRAVAMSRFQLSDCGFLAQRRNRPPPCSPHRDSRTSVSLGKLERLVHQCRAAKSAKSCNYRTPVCARIGGKAACSGRPQSTRLSRPPFSACSADVQLQVSVVLPKDFRT